MRIEDVPAVVESGAAVRPGSVRIELSTFFKVEWSHGAERASNDAVVSIAPSKIPYGGFSPVRLQG